MDVIEGIICISFAAVVIVDDFSSSDVEPICYEKKSEMVIDQQTGENVRELKYIETECPAYIVK